MQNTNEKNSDIDDISINTNIKVFNGGLGLLRNNNNNNNNTTNKKENINNKLAEKNKPQNINLLQEKENNNNNNNNNQNHNHINNKFKEISIDHDSLLETEGIISFRSKRVIKTDQEETSDLSNITTGIINKIGKIANRKDNQTHTNDNGSNNINKHEEMTINKIFKLNDERETEKEIKNFEKESQRIKSRILAGNPLESSSSEESEDFEKYDGFNTHKIKKTLDNINFQNNIKSSRQKNSKKLNNSFNKNNYNTISGKELDENNFLKNNFDNNEEDDDDNKSNSNNSNSNKSNSEGKENNEGNIFWNLGGKNS